MMCGIITLLTHDLSFEDLYQFKVELERNEGRGGDSVGIYALNLEKGEGLEAHTLKKSSNGLMDDIVPKMDFNDPYIVLGHTRATATGSRADFHPAQSLNGSTIITHNGIVDLEQVEEVWGDNDTYQWTNSIESFGLYGNNTLSFGTVAFILQRDIMSLIMVKMGTYPLYLKKEGLNCLYSSIGGNGWKNVKNGTFNIDLKNFKNKAIKDIIEFQEPLFSFDRCMYSSKVCDHCMRCYRPTKSKKEFWEDEFVEKEDLEWLKK